jgi:flavin reductase (DIM6/NTAB) family NADH-FMN oxidoreductase RutF
MVTSRARDVDRDSAGKASDRAEEAEMNERLDLDFWECASDILHHLKKGGVLCTVVDQTGQHNVLTLSWGQIGPFYHGHPVFVIAVTPLRYSWRFLEEVPEFVVAVPDKSLAKAAAFCGSRSGRDLDKFEAAGLSTVPSQHVRAPSIRECPINVECRIYARVAPPHMLLTPEHRQRPAEEQHTIYFAEVLGTYGWRDRA